MLGTEVRTTSFDETVRGLSSAVLTGRPLIVAVAACEQPARKRRGAEAGCDLCIPRVDFNILEQLMWLSRNPDRLREDSR